MMKIIGITGNIASGKSTISKIVANHLNVPLISVDEFSRNWIKTYDLYVRSILKKFGINNCDFDILDILRENLFINKRLKNRLEQDISLKFWTYIFDIQYSYDTIVIEHPLMFEMKQASHFDYVIGIHCDKKIRVDRMKNRGYSEDVITTRMAAQIAFQQNARYCDLVINTTNNPTEEYVIQQLLNSPRFEALVSPSAVS